MKQMITRCCMALVLVSMCGQTAAQTDTTFTYQGSLAETGDPADGAFNLDFTLWDSLAGGNQIGSATEFTNHPVLDGIFTVELDYGVSAFDNSARWLEITVNGVLLTPRQAITRSPYSIQTRGIFVDENNNVGIGTSTPFSPLHVVTDDAFTAILGSNNATSGFHYGGRFVSDSPSGSGVLGEATAFDGINYGVSGRNSSSEGVGVFGEAQASTGITLGGQFVSHSPSGRGVYGWATATGGGTNYGGYFQSDSRAGIGVYGEATNSSGFNYGVYGKSNSSRGIGVYGEATNTSDFNYGVQGENRSTLGSGVYGVAQAVSGPTMGVSGESFSTTGRGVQGWALANSGVNYGGRFQTNSTTGRGVYGFAPAATGINYGGWFESKSTVGRAIFGLANANSGVNYGVVGHSNSTDGYDFWASGAGANYGSPSSRRWKSNVVPIGDPLTKLAQMRGVYFDWDSEHGGAHDVGMLAEEVGAVMPEIVQYEENGVDAIGMDYSKMTPLLVEAVNALRVENDSLRASTAELQERFKKLEAAMDLLVATRPN